MGVLYSHDFKMYINYYQPFLSDEWSGFYLPYKAEALKHIQKKWCALICIYIYIYIYTVYKVK